MRWHKLFWARIQDKLLLMLAEQSLQEMKGAFCILALQHYSVLNHRFFQYFIKANVL